MPVTAEEAYVAESLDVARGLVQAGIPVFAAPPAPDTKVGFKLPNHWQQTKPDAVYIEAWQPGWALAMVCGWGLDVIDVDVYAGGSLESLNGSTPRIYGMASTASGGLHLFIASLGVASKNALFTGIDIKAGEAGGKGRGFVFIAPTVKASKITGQLTPYTWCEV